MHLVFVSNFLNHHQIPFCEKLNSVCDTFYFITTDAVSNIGYQKATQAAYVLNYFEDSNRVRCEELICTADVVIFGSCPNHLIALRMQQHKLSFLFTERFFKKGTWRRFIPTTRKGVNERIVKYKNEPMYALCAGAYVAHDLALLGYPTEKCYRWGYFPAVKRYDDLDALFARKQANEVPYILWAGRLLKWKHPEIPVRVAERLKRDGYRFSLNLIGGGESEADLQNSITERDLQDCVQMVGSMPPEELRAHMEKANIFLFTSDRYEGWGAVLNESMNSGCAVAAHRIIGSVPYLLKHGENGCIYGDENELYESVKMLLDHPKMQEQLGRAAYQSMLDMWNAETAAERLLLLIADLEAHGVSTRFSDGPCSAEGRRQ